MSSAVATQTSSHGFFSWLYQAVLHPLLVKTVFRLFYFIKPAVGYFAHPREEKCTKHNPESSPENSEPPSPTRSSFSSDDEHEVYDNPRLHPRNFLHGPLSHNPATRLRQMLARPGIVVSSYHLTDPSCVPNPVTRWPLVFAMASAYAAH